MSWNRIRVMAQELADQVVREVPEIRTVLDRMIRDAIRRALADNDELNRIVAEKVARAILRSSGDDDDE